MVGSDGALNVIWKAQNGSWNPPFPLTSREFAPSYATVEPPFTNATFIGRTPTGPFSFGGRVYVFAVVDNPDDPKAWPLSILTSKFEDRPQLSRLVTFLLSRGHGST